MLNKSVKFFIENKLIAVLLLLMIIVWGISTAPFNWNLPFIPNDPVAVDAIPDLGENQQIVFTNWPGRSPQDIEDQISYPLTTSLLGSFLPLHIVFFLYSSLPSVQPHHNYMV